MGAPRGIFNQHIPTHSRPLNAFEENSDEESEGEAEEDYNGPRARYTLEETTGIEQMTSTQSRLASIFRPPFDLIKNMDLDQAKAYALSKKQWLLVNIQNVTDFQCQVLNRDVWSNEEIKKIVKQNFTFVQVCEFMPF